MKRTVPIKDTAGNHIGDYGLGVMAVDTATCGRLWGHDGAVLGMQALALSSEGGTRQIAYGVDESHYQRLDPDGTMPPSPIDNALGALASQALCHKGSEAATLRSLASRRSPL